VIGEAAAAGDFVRALELALDAWRVTRDPLRADLVDALASHVPATPIDEREYHKSWLALARADRPADLGALLAGLRKALPRKRRPFSDESQLPASWLERMGALAARRDDPRIVRPLIDAMHVEWPAHGAGFVELYAAPARLIARTGDVRAIALLEALCAFEREQSVTHLRRFLGDVVVPLLAELRARPVPPPDPEIARLVETHRPQTPATSARVPELYAMVYANPGDDGARQVLADVLLELGDPRGELIALQLSPVKTEATASRIAALLRAHRPAWLGDLDTVLKNVDFERGFLASASLENNAKARPVVWERAAHDERLATVEHLYKGTGNAKHYSAFVFSPVMRNLKTVELLSHKMIEHVLAAPAPFAFEHVILASAPSGADAIALARTENLPAWSKLTVTTAHDDIALLASMLKLLADAHELGELCLHSPADRAAPAWFALVDRFAPAVLSDRYIRVYRRDGELVVEHRRTQFTTMHPDVIERHVEQAIPKYDRLLLL
jgi:uncharacterized protein (TIGR02996 family)